MLDMTLLGFEVRLGLLARQQLRDWLAISQMFSGNAAHLFGCQAGVLVGAWPNFQVWAEVALVLAAADAHFDRAFKAEFPDCIFERAQDLVFAIGGTVEVAAHIHAVVFFAH